MLSHAECIRPAALRRSLLEDYLYATDLPQAATADAVAAFRQEAEAAGWRTEITDGWIQLDRIPGSVDRDNLPGTAGPEARCCTSLQLRHPGKRKNGNREKRMLLKAAEEGPGTYERVCGILHREWAAALRNREQLPDVPAEYLTGGNRIC